MKEDFAWFIENYHDLFRQYGECYLAIKDKRVIGVYSTYQDGVKATQKSEDLGTFIVQRCGADESAYTNYISSMNFVA